MIISIIAVTEHRSFKKALVQLEMAAQNKGLKLGKILVCSRLGTDDGNVFYGTTEVLRRKEIEAR